MTFSRKQQWIIFGVVNGLLLLVLVLFPLYFRIAPTLPMSKCSFLEVLHLYCPSCGMTRALDRLLHLDILNALRYHPIIPLGAAAFLVYEGAMITYLIKGKERPFLLKPWMPIVFVSIWLVYFVVRNALLFGGIDLLGNIIR